MELRNVQHDVEPHPPRISSLPRLPNRVAYSCQNCRRNKQRCDRRVPCCSCIRRGKQLSCRYSRDIAKVNKEQFAAHGQPVCLSGDVSSVFSSRSPLLIEPERYHGLDSFSYSKTSYDNVWGLLKRLGAFDITLNSTHEPPGSQQITLEPAAMRKYICLIRELPSQSHVEALVRVFFLEVNWHYGILDQDILTEQLCEFYASRGRVERGGVQTLSRDNLFFPALLFQVAAQALQFLPAEHDILIDELCMEIAYGELSASYNDCGTRISNLLNRKTTNLMALQADFIKASWFKQAGLVAEAWHMLGKMIMDSKELELRQDDNVRCTNTGRMFTEATLHQRLMLNLFLWDCQMGLVLDKPRVMNPQNFQLSPTNTTNPQNWDSRLPNTKVKRKPDPFLGRVLEYRLYSKLYETQEFERKGVHDINRTRLYELHQYAMRYMATLPAIYRFINPDTSSDQECPWLPFQREHLRSLIWIFILMLHKPHIFASAESRKECVRASIEILCAEDRAFRHLQANQYKLFPFAFITLEAAVSVLTVLLTYPEEQHEQIAEASRCVQISISRLIIVRTNNTLAPAGLAVVEALYSQLKSFGLAAGGLTNGDSSNNRVSSTSFPDIEKEKNQSLVLPGDSRQDPVINLDWFDVTQSATVPVSGGYNEELFWSAYCLPLQYVYTFEQDGDLGNESIEAVEDWTRYT